MNHVFKRTVSSIGELRSLLGYPSELVQNKVVTKLDGHCRQFIEKSSLVFLATSDKEGKCDVSPRGDSTGFVHVLDESHLLIPERPGNRRMDTMRNILANANIGLVFMIPGLDETLRINGSACVVRDEDLLQNMEAHGHVPVLGIGVAVEECFIHCGKAFKRSGLWNAPAWPNKADLPIPSQILADHAKIPGLDGAGVEEALRESYTKRLY